MASIDKRILRIGVEVSGEIQWFQDLQITAKGTKLVSDTQNTCEATIFNLTEAVRNYILTETSPFNANRTPKTLIVEAGRVSTGVARVFEGDIVSSSPTQPPDIGLKIKAQTGAFLKGKLVARSAPPKQKLSELAAAIGGDLGMNVVFEAQDKFIANYSFSGAALRQVTELAQTGGVDAYVDDGALVIKDLGKPLKRPGLAINSSTGMIGVPEATERGAKVKVLFDLEGDLGGALQLTSQLNPALDGAYTIYKIDFDLASRDAPWYLDIEASRDGYDPDDEPAA